MLAVDSANVDTPRRHTATRPLLWVLLVCAAAASIATGLVTTVSVLAAAGSDRAPIPPVFWVAVAAGAAATCASLCLRTLRWTFLLRRTGIRIPLRDIGIGYLAGFSLLFVPLLLGEIAMRAYVHYSRARVPIATTATLVLWERLLDLTALAFIAAVTVGILAGPQAALFPLTLVAAMSTRSLRQMVLALAASASNAVARRSVAAWEPTTVRLTALTEHAAWTTALATSVAAWACPAIALWALAASWNGSYSLVQAEFAYAASALTGSLTLAPGGVRVVGAALIAYLTASGLSEPNAAITVLAVRLVTAGLATALGGIFVWIHVRTSANDRSSHFDEIAHAYDAQIPAAQRESLLSRKTALMQAAIARHLPSSPSAPVRGLDVGCGQGWYVARMRHLGFAVHGIDAAAGQVERARRHVDDPAAIAEGSALKIDAPDAAYDFVYTINVLHHLATVEEQRLAFAELLRVLRPGGLLFVHEINTRNVVFRFYMGYIFPSLNCIDEGTERWLLPHRLGAYTAAPVVATEYFTFMPEFVPAFVLRMLRPLEKVLESSPLRVFSAHYMAVVRKPVDAL